MKDIKFKIGVITFNKNIYPFNYLNHNINDLVKIEKSKHYIIIKSKNMDMVFNEFVKPQLETIYHDKFMTLKKSVTSGDFEIFLANENLVSSRFKFWYFDFNRIPIFCVESVEDEIPY